MKYIKEPEKQIPVLSEYDTFVAGGGIAGISAALVFLLRSSHAYSLCDLGHFGFV